MSEREVRKRPDEERVRSQLRDEAANVDGDGDGVGANGNSSEAAGEQPAAAQADPAAEAPEEQQPAEEDPLAIARRERDEYLELAKRTQADFENYRKRSAKDISAAGNRARIGLIRELLPVVDNLERALAVPHSGDDAFVEGVRLVYGELSGVLSRTGVEPIEPSGAQFDPNEHEALTTREQEGTDAGVVLDVVEKGYRTADMVIRPARVVVAA